MPEGHTLHRLAGALDSAFAGTRPEVSSPQGRFVDGAALLDGEVLERAEAYGKHLFVTWAGERILNVHLGLIGSWDVMTYAGGRGAEPPPIGAVRIRLLGDDHVADLRGATLVHLVSPEQVEATIARLGPDPLRIGTEGNDPSRSLARLARTGRTVAECLMDQSIIAGVGNVYRCEVLHRHRVDPFVPGNQVRPRTWLAMWDDLVAMLPIGVAFGQIITLDEGLAQARELLAGRDPLSVDASWGGVMPGERGRRGRREEAGPIPREFAVYQRDGLPCHTCGSRIRTKVVAGRNLFWCGRCQRRR